MSGGVTQLADDGGEEDTERADWQVDGMEANTVEPDLRVPQCLDHTAPSKLFFLRSVAIFFESCNNVFPFPGGEELGSCGIAVDEEVCGNGNDCGQKTLLYTHVSHHINSQNRRYYDDKYPPPSIQTGDALHLGDAKRLRPFERHVGCLKHRQSLTSIPPNPPARVAVERSKAIR